MQLQTDQEWYIVRREVGGTRSRDTKDKFEKELESVLEKNYSLIVIEPRTLGDDVIRWIKFGNFLHKSSVIANLGTLILLPLVPGHLTNYIPIPLGIFGISCAFVYNISWQYDPCCKYQVDWYGDEIARVPSHELSTRSPVVLVRRNDIYRKVLHTSLSLVICSYFIWRIYKIYY